MSALTTAKINKLKAKEKPYRVSDRDRLYLQIAKTGSKLWRYNHTYLNKPNTLALGRYPEVSLKEARQRLSQVKILLVQGINPVEQRKGKKDGQHEHDTSFQGVAEAWCQFCMPIDINGLRI